MKKYMKQISVLIILLLAFFISGCGDDDWENEIEEKSAIEAYEKTTALLRSDSYSLQELKDVSTGLVTFVSDRTNKKVKEKILAKYPDGEVIYNYTQSMIAYYEKKSSFAKYGFDKIPLNYNGDLSESIKRDRKLVTAEDNKFQQQQEQKQEQQKKERASKIYIDDPEEKIIKVYGQPNEVNKTVTKYGVSKQYVYDHILIYTEDGYVSGWQNW